MLRTVGEFVTHVSTQLNDQRPNRAFTRWGRDLLLQYLILGLREIATYRPEAYASEKVLTLKPGASQSVEAGTSLSALVSNEDGTPILEGDTRMATAFNAFNPCPLNISMVGGVPKFLVRTYSIDQSNANRFIVDPPVPKGMTVRVNATVLGEAEEYKLADWDKPLKLNPKFHTNLIDYMLACAYGLDQESPTSLQRSQQLYRKFYDVMGVKYRIESKYRSGYYLGEVGTGDPQAGNR